MKKYIWYNFQKIHCLEINGKQKNSISKRRTHRYWIKRIETGLCKNKKWQKIMSFTKKKMSNNFFKPNF